jgi:hypothetical protein
MIWLCERKQDIDCCVAPVDVHYIFQGTRSTERSHNCWVGVTRVDRLIGSIFAHSMVVRLHPMEKHRMVHECLNSAVDVAVDPRVNSFPAASRCSISSN